MPFFVMQLHLTPYIWPWGKGKIAYMRDSLPLHCSRVFHLFLAAPLIFLLPLLPFPPPYSLAPKKKQNKRNERKREISEGFNEYIQILSLARFPYELSLLSSSPFSPLPLKVFLVMIFGREKDADANWLIAINILKEESEERKQTTRNV